MKTFTTVSAFAAAVLAVPVPQFDGGNTGGSGPYPAQWTTDDALPAHTIYAPIEAPEGAMPVLVWGNGACSGDGTGYATFLLEIASHGFLVVSSGAPGGTVGTTAQDMTASIEWAAGEGASAYGTIDAANIAAAGHSCGGQEAYAQNDIEAIKSLGIFNSGFFSSDGSINAITKPTFYFMGGPSDIAYENGERDYAELMGVPKWIGNIDIGHGGTYYEPEGGAYANAAVAWLQWTLQGSAEGAEYYNSGLDADGWVEVESDGLEGLPTGGAGETPTTPPSNGTAPVVPSAPVAAPSAPVAAPSAPVAAPSAPVALPSSAPIAAPPVVSSAPAPAASVAAPAAGGMQECEIVYV